MNAALIGSVSSSAAALRGMLRGGLEVAAVCGLHARHAERVSDYHDLRPMAAAAGVPYAAFDKATEPAVRAILERTRPDWLFVIGLSQLVPAELRDLARRGAIGFHPTPLPKGRGRAPVAWTILLQQPAAANLFFLSDEADAGDIIDQRPVEVRPDDYAADLIERTNVVLEQMVVDLCPGFTSGNVPRRPQDHSQATYYARRRPEDGLIDWQRPAEEIYRLVRAVSRPYPGAFTHRTGRKLIVWRARPVDLTSVDPTQVIPRGVQPTPADPVGFEPSRSKTDTTRSVPSGTVVSVMDGYPVVQAGNGGMMLEEVQWVEAEPSPLGVGARLG